MVIKGFSKVTDIVDEDDELERSWEAAKARYSEAQRAFEGNTQRSGDVLKQFVEAETLMKPCMQSGLIGLTPEQLATVLKGRLHQSVLVARTPAYPRRWTVVKDLVEEILQYDNHNCHAHYLRSLALLYGEQRASQAQESMRKAMEFAEAQGKKAELTQWTREMDMVMREETSGQADEEQPPRVQLDELEELEELEEAAERDGEQAEASKSEPKAAEAPQPSPPQAPGAPAMMKGFLNRPSRRKAPAAAAPAADPASQGGQASSSSAPPPAKQTQEEPSEQMQELRRRVHEQEEQRREAESQRSAAEERLEELKLQLQEQERKRQEAESQRSSAEERRRAAEVRLEEWQHELCEGLDGLGAEFERGGLEDRGQDGREEASAAALQGLRASAGKVREHLESSRKWCEDEHRRYMDFSTEVATVKEMASRELRERQEASRQQLADVRELVGRVGELKTTAKALREQAHKKATVEEMHAEAEKDVHQLADRVADFRALPAGAKAAAFLGDAAVLRLMLLAFLLGMLLMLGIITEFLGPKRCRLDCSLQG